MALNTYKIVLLGDGGVGKSAFVKRHLDGIFEKKYIATMGVDVHPFRQNNVCFNLWDCAGKEIFGGLRDGYYIQAQGAIFFFDLTNKLSLVNLQKWIQDCHRVTGNIPCIIVGLKSDIPNVIEDEEVKKYIGDIPYVKVSSKNKNNINEPFKMLKSLLQ